MTLRQLAGLTCALTAVLWAPAPTIVQAQGPALGSFTWQLQPFCNRVTVQVTQAGGLYTVEGFDDQCGAPQRAPLVGTVTPNPDGSIGFGLHVVTVPGGRGLQIEARITIATLGGSWRDSAGNSGTFAFNGANGGSPRPQPTIPGSAIAPGSITATQIAAGSITAAQINPSVVQRRVTGMCANGQALRGVNPDGSVACTNALTTVDDPANDVGHSSSIAIGTDGWPVIAHQDGTATALRVTHCGNAACTAGNTSTTVDATANLVGSYPSIAIGTDGLPVISHMDRTIGALRVTHCGNTACTAGNVSTTVDGPPNFVGWYSSIAIGADGLPVISYGDTTANALRVTHCGNVTCTAGNVSVTVDDPADSVGMHTSIAVGTDRLPIISHQNSSRQALRVTHCGNAGCTAGNVSTTVDDPTNRVGLSTSIAIGADGLPVISHTDSTVFAARVTRCGNAACTANNVSTNITAPFGGFETSVAIAADGLPVVAHGTASGALQVTHCGNASCAAGNASFTVDDPVNSVGWSLSMAIGADGLPVISHRDSTAGALRVAKCGTVTCQ